MARPLPEGTLPIEFPAPSSANSLSRTRQESRTRRRPVGEFKTFRRRTFRRPYRFLATTSFQVRHRRDRSQRGRRSVPYSDQESETVARGTRPELPVGCSPEADRFGARPSDSASRVLTRRPGRWSVSNLPTRRRALKEPRRFPPEPIPSDKSPENSLASQWSDCSFQNRFGINPVPAPGVGEPTGILDAAEREALPCSIRCRLRRAEPGGVP